MVRGKTILVIGFIVMCFNSLYQYAWNALLPLFKSGFNTSVVEIEVAFTLFTIFSTTFQIIGGSIADYRGPRLIGLISSLLSAIGFLGTSFSRSIYEFYAFWSLGSAGEGILYGIAANLAVKWFPDKRGFATGFISLGFGLGSAIGFLGTSFSHSIYEFYAFWSLGSAGEGILYGIAANLAVKWFPDKRGFATGFISLGFGLGSAIANPFISMATNFRLPTLLIGLIELVALPLLLYSVDYPKKVKGDKPTQVVRTLTWWLIYISFSTSAVPLTVLSSSLSYLAPKYLLVFLITVFPFLSGMSRPIIGHLSDRLGRVRVTSAVLFAMVVGSLFFLLGLIVPSVLIIGFFGGSMITLFFALSGDIFGEKYSTANNAILYTGKAVAGFLGSTLFSLLFLYNPFYAKLFVLANAVIGFALITVIVKKGSSKRVLSS